MAARSRQAETERDREAAAAVVAERERIARELHDSVAHAVTLMVVQAGAAETALGDDAQTAEALAQIRSTGHEAVADLGRMVGLLRNEVEPVHGIGEPDRLVERFREAGLEIDLDVQGVPRPLPGGLDSAAFRIAQEALTNALKHGSAGASLTIRYAPEHVYLRIENPVATQTNGHAGTGHGVTGMRERARLYGGHLQAGPTADGVYTVEATLPALEP
jgi:signal transduction histidine kinase